MSGLEYQLVDVRFTEGLDTRTQPKVKLPGKWETLNNLTLSEDNTPKRRYGISTILDTLNGNGLATHDNELLVLNAQSVSSVSLSSTAASPVTGEVGYVEVSKTEVLPAVNFHNSMDCATGGGFTVYVWRTWDYAGALGLGMTVVDEETGAKLVSDFTLVTSASAICPRVVFDGTDFFIFYISGTSLFGRILTTATPTSVGAQTALITSASLAIKNFDACVGQAATGATVVYGWGDGTTSVRAVVVQRSGAIPAITAGPTNVIPEASLNQAHLIGLAVVSFNSGNLVGVFALAATTAGALSGLSGTTLHLTLGVILAVSAGPTLLDATAAPVSPGGNNPCHVTGVLLQSGTIKVFCDMQSEYGRTGSGGGGVIPYPMRTVTADSAQAIIAGPSTLANTNTYHALAGDACGPQGPFIFGKAFIDSRGTPLLPVCVLENLNTSGTAPVAGNITVVSNNQQCSMFLLDGNTGAVVGKALYGTFGMHPLFNEPVSTPCSVIALSAYQFAVLVPERTRLVLVNGVNQSPDGICRLNFDTLTTIPLVRAQIGSSTYFAGGNLTTFDSAVVVEHGFDLYPEGVSAFCVTPGGPGGLVSGTYQVVVVYERIDGFGARHQSAPSPAVSITTAGGAGDVLHVEIPTLQLTQKQNVYLVPYCTLPDGLAFYRCAQNGTGGTAYAPLVNDKTLTTQQFIIATIDASEELLYTQPDQAGTTLPNIVPPPSTALTVHQNRIFLDASDDPNVFWYSQQIIRNVGLQFSDELTLSVPVDAGGIIAFRSMDEKLIILCKRKLYVVVGTGPAPSGGFNNYAEPQEIQSDVGCVEARSVLSMPMGVIFKAEKGWHLLGRDLSVKYIGDGVKAFDAQSVSSAVLLDDRKECRFSTRDQNGYQLVFSYLVNQWSTFSSSLDGQSYDISDAMWWPTIGAYVSVTGTRGLNKEDTSSFDDSPGGLSPFAVNTRARTGWLRVNSIEGFQRVRWLYLTGTAHTGSTVQSPVFTIGVDFDDAYNGTAPGSYSFNVDLSAIAFPTEIVDLRHKLHRQKCKSVAFTFAESPNAGDGPETMAGIQALTLQVGIKKGTNKLPAAQSVG